MAKSIAMKHKEGDAAPPFSVITQDGSTRTLADYAGKHLIVYFYPRDDTPGCTKEACGFRDLHAEYQSKNIIILGVSPDSVKTHNKFITKYSLPFTLAADENQKMANDYGVWGEKSFMGRKYMGIFRTTFWIGPNGKIRKIWAEVKPDQHAVEVLKAVESES